MWSVAGFLFFYFDLEFFKRVQSSEPSNKKMPRTSILPIGWRTFI
jgi:hypothetical protein